MPYTVFVRTNKTGRSYTYYTRREADRMSIPYLVPPISEKEFDEDIKHVLTENDYVIPILSFRWQTFSTKKRIPGEYVTPYGTAPATGTLFCPCTPKGFLSRMRPADETKSRMNHIMARWLTVYGDASIAYRMTYGRAASKEELEAVLADEAFQTILRNEMLNAGDDLAVPIKEIVKSRLRMTTMMEEVIRHVCNRVINSDEPSYLEEFMALFQTQIANLTDLERGYIRNEPDGSERSVEFNWRVKAKGSPKLPPVRQPFSVLPKADSSGSVTDVDVSNIEPLNINAPEGFTEIMTAGQSK